MPTRSFNSSVMRWPGRDEVHAAALRWARRLARADTTVAAVGYFGSYARGQAGVGSDLDLVVLVRGGPAETDCLRGGRVLGGVWATEHLPVPADLLVYTLDQWARLAADRPRFHRTLSDETVWLTGAPHYEATDGAADRGSTDSIHLHDR